MHRFTYKIYECFSRAVSVLYDLKAINARMEEFIKSNKTKVADIDFSDEAKQKELCQRDDEEDFLDEGNWLSRTTPVRISL